MPQGPPRKREAFGSQVHEPWCCESPNNLAGIQGKSTMTTFSGQTENSCCAKEVLMTVSHSLGPSRSLSSTEIMSILSAVK